MPKQSYMQRRLKKIKFFDRDVLKGISVGHAKALARFGAYVRSDAKRSLRTARSLDKSIASGRRKKGTKGTIRVYRPAWKTDKMGGVIDEGGKKIRILRNPSTPGSPPRSIKGQLKRFLFFSYDDSNGPNVVVGSEWLPQAKNLVSKFPVPAMHEQNSPLHKYVTRRKKKNSGLVAQKYPERPYMKPAFASNIPKLPTIYKDVIKKRR